MSAWSDEPLNEDEFPDADDWSDDNDDGVLGSIAPCPNCGCGMYEDAPRCPRCGQWVTAGVGKWRRSRKWYVRSGLWISRVLLANWIFWIASTAAGVIAFWMSRK